MARVTKTFYQGTSFPVSSIKSFLRILLKIMLLRNLGFMKEIVLWKRIIIVILRILVRWSLVLSVRWVKPGRISGAQKKRTKRSKNK
jgi:uncharacterized membrane protein